MKPFLQDAGTVVLGAETFVLYNDLVLMHKRAATKKTFPNFLVAPGGHIDADDDILRAAIREVKEETGVNILEKNTGLKAVACHNHLDRGELYLIFIFRSVISSHQDLIHSDEGTSEWVLKKDLLQRQDTFPASKYYFDHVLEDTPGILYTNIQWNNGTLVRVLSQSIEKAS